MRKTSIKHPYLRAFKVQRYNAHRRCILFLLSFEQWLEWWGDDLPRRGRTRDAMVMARYFDSGAYMIGNIYKTTQSANVMHMDHSRNSERMKVRNAERKRRGEPHHLAARGDGHPKSQAIMTPAGRFGSMALAAEHYGVSRVSMRNWVKSGKEGFTKHSKQ
jgi:hypothetical protein